MMHSLWRGGAEIGRIRQPGDSGNGQAGTGMLTPNGAFAITRSMSQTRISIIPDSPTIQEEVGDHIIGAERSEGPQVAELEPLDRKMDVPPELVLELRAEDGSVIDADIIMLQRLVVAPGVPPEVAARIGNEWMITYLRMF